jgi:hypothetical protein
VRDQRISDSPNVRRRGDVRRSRRDGAIRQRQLVIEAHGIDATTLIPFAFNECRGALDAEGRSWATCDDVTHHMLHGLSVLYQDLKFRRALELEGGETRVFA